MFSRRFAHLLCFILFQVFLSYTAFAETYYINLLDFPKATNHVLEKAKHDFSLIGKLSVDDIPPLDPDVAVIQGNRLLLHFRGSEFGNTKVFCFDTKGDFLYGYELSCADYTGIALTLEDDSFIAVSFRVFPATIAKINVNQNTVDYYTIPSYTFGNTSYSFYYESDWSIVSKKNGKLIISNKDGDYKTIYDHSEAVKSFQSTLESLQEKDKKIFYIGICGFSLSLLFIVIGLKLYYGYLHDNINNHYGDYD